MLLRQGFIPLTEIEGDAIAKLLAKHAGAATLTRRDPGETGPVLVHVDDDTWQVDATGKTKKLRKAGR